MADRRKAERRGRRGEGLAALYLQLKGYRILDRRVRTPSGEIDLIAKKSNLVAFVEVKARNDLSVALHSVTPTAQTRISRAAELWMARQRDLGNCDWRFDIVAIVPGRWPHHARDAWRPR
ncbi:MAG: YraN family protein [Pseudomonadota bacterium]